MNFRLLPMAVAFLLAGCVPSTKPWVMQPPPPKLTCEKCADSECPDVIAPAVPVDDQGEGDPDDVGDAVLVGSGTYRRCRECAIAHERCLIDETRVGRIRW